MIAQTRRWERARDKQPPANFPISPILIPLRHPHYHHSLIEFFRLENPNQKTYI